MVRRHKNVYRFQDQNKFAFVHAGFGWSYVGSFEQREYDEVVSWSFVFSQYATQDAAANKWVTEQLYALNEVK